MTNVIALVASFYLVFVGALFFFQRNLLYYPDDSVPSPVASGVPEMSPVTAETGDGLALRSWYRAAEEGRPTVVFFHGNAGNIGSRGFKVRSYLDAGFGVLLVGYRGYGGNPGSPTEQGLYADGRAALEFLDGEGVAARLWVLYGESLGSGVAVRMAAERASTDPVGALVLEAPFSSIVDVASHHYPYVPVGWLIKDRFDSAAVIADVRAPVLIVHGREDRTIPMKFGARLFEAAVEPKESHWLEGADHNNLHDFGIGRLTIEFIERHLAVPALGRNGTNSEILTLAGQ